MESVAASGGYYAAAAADHIVANPGTITGSIGVIVQWTNYADLLEWHGCGRDVQERRPEGRWNPTRALSDDERKFFDELIGAMLGQFRQAVTDGRKNRLKPGAMDRLADGRVITGEEALASDRGRDRRLPRRGRPRREARGMSVPAEVWHPKKGRPGLLELLTGLRNRRWRDASCPAPRWGEDGTRSIYGRPRRRNDHEGGSRGRGREGDRPDKEQAEVIVESVFDGSLRPSARGRRSSCALRKLPAAQRGARWPGTRRGAA